MSSTNDNLDEAASALSDEQSSGTLSSPGQSDILLTAGQGTVRKAGALAVKNFLVHKKNKKVELATRRKWKQYWVSLKGIVDTFSSIHLDIRSPNYLIAEANVNPDILEACLGGLVYI